MRIWKKFFHYKLIIDFFSYTPSFFIGFEFFKSFYLNFFILKEFFFLRKKKPLHRILIEAQVRHINLNNILWKEEILKKNKCFSIILFTIDLINRLHVSHLLLQRDFPQGFDAHACNTEKKEREKSFSTASSSPESSEDRRG
jgi:hypothetical protein